MSLKKIVFDIVIAVMVLFAIFLVNQKYGDAIKHAIFSDSTSYTVYIDTVALGVTLADTEKERREGLSGVESLPKLGGKLFIFDEEQRHGIWMKDMNFPIDIMWFNNNLELVHIEENVDPSTYPKVFGPNKDARFVLETNSHFVDSIRVQIGNRLTLPPSILPTDIKESLQQ